MGIQILHAQVAETFGYQFFEADTGLLYLLLFFKFFGEFRCPLFHHSFPRGYTIVLSCAIVCLTKLSPFGNLVPEIALSQKGIRNLFPF